MNKLHKLIREELYKTLHEDEYGTNDYSNEHTSWDIQPAGDDKPEDEDCFIADVVRGGYDVSCGGKFLIHVGDFDDAITEIIEWQNKNKYWPNIWFVNDHGNVSLIDNKGKYIESVVKEDLTTMASYGALILAMILAVFPQIKNFMKNVSDYGIKDLYKMWKKDTTIGPVLDRLSKDPEIANHLKTKGTKGIRNIINSKLMDNEKQYINKVYGQDIQMIIRKAEREKSL